MFDRILVPLDGGPRGELALRAAEQLSRAWSAPLDVLGLVEVGSTVGNVETAIDRQTAHLKTHRSVTVKATVFRVSEEIGAAIESTPSTLVVMATSARSRSAALVDSVAEAVLASIGGPALLIGPNASIPTGWPAGPMFVCTDGSAYSEEILPHVATLSGLELAPWLLTVNEPVEVAASVPAGIDTNYTARLAARLRPRVEQEVNFDVLHGTDPAKDIVDYARANGAGLIALTTHGSTGLRRLVMGSVAMRVVHDAHCPVRVARPRDAR